MYLKKLTAEFKELLNDGEWIAIFGFLAFMGTATAIVGAGLLWMMSQQ